MLEYIFYFRLKLYIISIQNISAEIRKIVELRHGVNNEISTNVDGSYDVFFILEREKK